MRIFVECSWIISNGMDLRTKACACLLSTYNAPKLMEKMAVSLHTYHSLLDYTATFYIVVVVISPFCVNLWDFNCIICGQPYYFTANFLGQFDFFFNIAVPIVIIMPANVAIFIRVIHQNISRHQLVRWRSHRKMALQLWRISSLYMTCWLPFMIASLVQINVMSSFMMDQINTLTFLIYFIPLLLPMICLGGFPELVKKIKNTIAPPKINVIGISVVLGVGVSVGLILDVKFAHGTVFV